VSRENPLRGEPEDRLEACPTQYGAGLVNVHRAEGRFYLQLGHWEKRLLMELLELYPRTGSTGLRRSNAKLRPEVEASQRLLDEALAEHRTETKKRMEALLADPNRFEKTEAGARLSLTPPEVEWFLQLLNDIRVGSWVLLGSPEGKVSQLNEQTAPYVWALEMSAYFQEHLLEAMEGET